MADKNLQSITFPGIDNKYNVPQVDSTLSNTGRPADAKATGDALATKANQSGTYPDMTAGNAKQLESSLREVDRVPYNFRSAGGRLEIGDREYPEVHGGSMVWNQLINVLPVTKTTNGLTYTNNNDGSVTVSGTSENFSYVTSKSMMDAVNNPTHKFYLRGCPSGGSRTTYAMYSGSNLAGLADIGNGVIFSGNEWTASDGALFIVGAFSSGQTVSNLVFKPQLFDLTLLLTPTIADYLYTLETATAGSGIAKLKSWGFFTKDYYLYHVPSMESVQVSAHKMVGFNAYNPETGKALVLGGHEYKIEGTYTGLTIDGETITPVDGLFTPAENGELVVSGGGDDTCIFIHWDNSRDGEYQPYTEYTYPLDDSLTLRGIPKKDEDGNLYYDGDVYEADGTVTRRYALYQLTSFTGIWGATDNGYAVYKTMPVDKNENVLSNRFTYSTAGYQNMPLGSFVGTSGSLSNWTYILPNTVTSLNEANAWLENNPTYVIYPLDTPTTETAEPFQSPQIVDNWGTEEYIDAGDRDFDMPVGHRTEYPVSLKDKIESAPNLPATDGIYVLKYENGQASYVLLESVSNA